MRENQEVNLVLGLGDGSSAMTPEAQATEGNTAQLDFTNVNLLASKDSLQNGRKITKHIL